VLGFDGGKESGGPVFQVHRYMSQNYFVSPTQGFLGVLTLSS